MTKKLPRRWAKRAALPAVSLGTGAPTGVDALGAGAPAGVAADAATPPEQNTPAVLEPEAAAIARAARDGGQDTAGRALASAALGRTPVTMPATPTRRALVVDDDPEICRALARLLRPELEVHLAGSVAQAEALLERLDRVDLAFIDWQLPDGTGEQILERLADWPDAVRVLISARASSETLLENRALANLVLSKPLALGVIEALKRAALALPHD